MQRVKKTIRPNRIAIYILIFFTMSFLYHTTLWINRAGYNDKNDNLFNVRTWFFSGGLQYSLMLIASAVIYYVIFILCQGWKFRSRLLLHIAGLPVFVFIAHTFFYWVCDSIGVGHLRGSGAIWDIYIPSLIYLILFSLLHAYEYYGIVQQKLRYEIELRNMALKSELSAIKAQLNPHFLYNAFNTISASLPPENERTRDMIALLSDLFRYQLQASKQDVVTLKEELEFVQEYLELEKERFEERLDVTINVPEALLHEKIPPMILQPLVENSVKHGLSTLIEGGSICIAVYKKDGKLQFEVSDTGVGVKDKVAVIGTGVGLTNTKLRLQKMYNTTLELTDNNPRGLMVKFAI